MLLSPILLTDCSNTPPSNSKSCEMAREAYGASPHLLTEFSVPHFPGSRYYPRMTFVLLNYSFSNGQRCSFLFWFRGRTSSLRQTRCFHTWSQVHLRKLV